jgi:hypothetical protein
MRNEFGKKGTVLEHRSHKSVIRTGSTGLTDLVMSLPLTKDG